MPAGSDYLVTGGAAAVVTMVLTPIARAQAVRRSWVTPPDDRRVHTVPTPSIGGLAMFGGFAVALGIASQMSGFASVFTTTSEPLAVALAALVVTLVGFVDELKKSRPNHRAVAGLSAPAKLTGLVAAGVILVFGGVTLWHFRVPFLRVLVLPDDLRPLVTVLWLLGMANAINLIDGLDGLAAGIVAIASGAFFVYSYRLDNAELLFGPSLGPLIASIVLGMCLGFLPYNIHPARIFMGDCGALLLGLLMAVCTSVVGGRADPELLEGTSGVSGQTYFFFAPLFIPLVILGVPLFDMAFAIVRRAIRRQGIVGADAGHLHHRLVRLGHGHRRSVLILWLWTAILSGLVLYPSVTGRGNGLVPFAIAALALLLFTVLHPEARKRVDGR